MASYKDIRRETGLALSTISRYFNGLTVLDENRSAIEAAAERLGVRPNAIARSLRLQRTGTVGVLLPALDDDFHLALIAGVERRLREDDLSVLVVSSGRPEDDAVELLRRQRVDGIIAVPSEHDAAPLAAAAEAMPVVLIDRRLPGLQVDGVFLDNAAAGRSAARHLLDHGHRHVGILTGPRAISTMRERTTAAEEELRLAGGASWSVQEAALTVTAGHDAMAGLLSLPRRPSAVVAMNVDLALGALIAVNESGLRLGRELSMIGFDGRQLAQAALPRLTIIAQPNADIAAAAAELMLRRLSGETAGREPIVRVLAPELVVGGSVARLDEVSAGRR